MTHKSIYAAIMAMLMMAGATTLTACGDDNDGEISKDKEEVVTPTTSKTFEVNAYRCERVGSVLQIECTITNKTNKAIKANVASSLLYFKGATDNLGNEYAVDFAVGMDDAIALGDFYLQHEVTFRPDKPVYIIAKVPDFDPTNRAKKASLTLMLESDDLQYNVDYNYEGDYMKLPVADNMTILDRRILTSGVQVPDTALVIDVTGYHFQREVAYVDWDDRECDALYISYTITNNSRINMGKVTICPADDSTDDAGNEYHRGAEFLHSLGKQAIEIWEQTEPLGPGQTITGTMKLIPFDYEQRGADKVNLNLSISASQYYLSDDLIRFINIPVTR
ncbi:MAG: hypothetical protein J5486_10470 [Bacteroidaceae bacterium]|nr:hypothetical protein [Bacteroidaceae bacterium]